MLRSQVVVARYNPQHSFRLAVALQKSGLLAEYYTGLYTSWQHPPFSALHWLPFSVRSAIDRRVFSTISRHDAELDPGRVRVLGVYANILMALLYRCGVRQPWELPPFRQRSQRFERQVAKAASDRADVLVLYDGNAYHALVATEHTSLIRVLDLATIHWAAWDKLLREESDRWPEYRDQIPLPSREPARFAKLVAEPSLADFVLVASRWAKATCIENGCAPDRVYVVPLGVDTHLFHPPTERRPTNSPLRILYVGSNSPAKGFHYLVQALEALADLPIEVWCCGLKAGGGTPAGNGRIRALGFRPHKQVAELMRQVDMLCHPSIADGFSFACLEAMASGLPVVTTPRSGVAELISTGKNGFVVPYGDIEAMSGAIRTIYGDPELGREIGCNARQTAEQCTWSRYEEQVAKVFAEVMRRGKP